MSKRQWTKDRTVTVIFIPVLITIVLMTVGLVFFLRELDAFGIRPSNHPDRMIEITVGYIVSIILLYGVVQAKLKNWLKKNVDLID